MPPPKPRGHGHRLLSKFSSACGHQRSSIACRHRHGKQQGSKAMLARSETCRSSPGLRDGSDGHFWGQEDSAEPPAPAPACNT